MTARWKTRTVTVRERAVRYRGEAFLVGIMPDLSVWCEATTESSRRSVRVRCGKGRSMREAEAIAEQVIRDWKEVVDTGRNIAMVSKLTPAWESTPIGGRA